MVVGHAIANDIRVCRPGLFDGAAIRDTQIHGHYRRHATGEQRLPKLAVLAEKELGIDDLQDEEHSSVDDARATIALWKKRRSELEAEQGDWVWNTARTEEEMCFEEDKFEIGELQQESVIFEKENSEELVTLRANMSLSNSALFWQSKILAGKAESMNAPPTIPNLNTMDTAKPGPASQIESFESHTRTTSTSSISRSTGSSDSKATNSAETYNVGSGTSLSSSPSGADATMGPFVKLTQKLSSPTKTTWATQLQPKALWSSIVKKSEISASTEAPKCGTDKVAFKKRKP